MARATLVVAPLLAFNVFRLRGGVTLLMVLPVLILAATFLTTAKVRFPGWELALLALMTLSILWGDDPNYSTERLRTYLPLLLATVLAAAVVSTEVVMRCLKVAFAILMGWSVLTILLDPATRARAGSSDLVLTAQFSKNVYGGLLVIALVLLVSTRRRANLVLVPVLALLIAYNQSVTAWVVSVLLVAVTYASRTLIARLGARGARPILAVMLAGGLGGTALLLLSSTGSALEAVGKDSTLGRRTEIWSACWEQIQLVPLQGHGAFTFLDAASDSPVTQFVWARFQNYRPPHPHNGLLDLWGQLGLVGVVVFAAMILHGFRRGSRAALAGDVPALTAVLCLAFIVVFGVTEPTYLGPWLVVTVMCVAVADPRGAPRTLADDPGVGSVAALAEPARRS